MERFVYTIYLKVIPVFAALGNGHAVPPIYICDDKNGHVFKIIYTIVRGSDRGILIWVSHASRETNPYSECAGMKGDLEYGFTGNTCHLLHRITNGDKLAYNTRNVTDELQSIVAEDHSAQVDFGTTSSMYFFSPRRTFVVMCVERPTLCIGDASHTSATMLYATFNTTRKRRRSPSSFANNRGQRRRRGATPASTIPCASAPGVQNSAFLTGLEPLPNILQNKYELLRALDKSLPAATFELMYAEKFTNQTSKWK